MRIISCAFLCLVLSISFPSKADEFDINSLMILIENNDQEGTNAFFSNKFESISKTAHLLDFMQIFRKNLEQQYGLSLTWREIYVYYKQIMPYLDMKHKHKKQLKEILKQTVILEKGKIIMHSSSFTMTG